jgi:hypothetical protein
MKTNLVYATETRSKIAEMDNKFTILKGKNEILLNELKNLTVKTTLTSSQTVEISNMLTESKQMLIDNKLIRDEIAAQLSAK